MKSSKSVKMNQLAKLITDKSMVALNHRVDAEGNPIIQCDFSGIPMHPLINHLFDSVHDEEQSGGGWQDGPQHIEIYDDVDEFKDTLIKIENDPHLLLAGIIDIRDAHGRNIFMKAIQCDCYHIVKTLLEHNIMVHNLRFHEPIRDDLYDLLENYGLIQEMPDEFPRTYAG